MLCFQNRCIPSTHSILSGPRHPPRGLAPRPPLFRPPGLGRCPHAAPAGGELARPLSHYVTSPYVMSFTVHAGLYRAVLLMFIGLVSDMYEYVVLLSYGHNKGGLALSSDPIKDMLSLGLPCDVRHERIHDMTLMPSNPTSLATPPLLV